MTEQELSKLADMVAERISMGPKWSYPHSLKHWSKVYGVDSKRLRELMEDGTITTQELSQRRIQVAVSDLPLRIPGVSEGTEEAS